MTYIYEMCPHCLDELIERKQPPEDEESINYCPKCGKKMEWALGSEQRIDDTVTYKIILNNASCLEYYSDRKNRFIEELMKMGNIAFDEALEKCRTKDSLIFEGNTKEIYLKMELLDRFTPWIDYTVVPDIAFERYIAPFYSICPTCGSDIIDKDGGLFCPVCNKWFLSTPL